ncbi:MAG: YceI family protein [Arcicella sp.]|nr:YceI family protein [Arcicella sp.]
MKKYLLLLLIFIPKEIKSQHLYLSKSASVKLFSEAPLENISATNQAANAIIDFNKQEIAVKIPINRFVFPSKLMQTHFNENYMESHLFPYATFKGFFNKKVDINKAGNLSISVNGTMTIHGVSNMEIIEGRMTIDPQNKTVSVITNFSIKLSDYKIDVPSVVIYKISERIEISTNFTLTPMPNALSINQ